MARFSYAGQAQDLHANCLAHLPMCIARGWKILAMDPTSLDMVVAKIESGNHALSSNIIPPLPKPLDRKRGGRHLAG